MMSRIVLALALSLTCAAAHAADRRMISYDSASPEARRLTGAGLTFVFERAFLRTRVLAVRATAVPVGVEVEPLRGAMGAKLDALMGEDARHGTFYEIAEDEAQGPVMVQAFCPGSRKGWLAIGAIANARPLRVHAFGDDPATGEPRLCATMDFAFRGEWRVPRYNPSDPMDAIERRAWDR